MNVPNGGLVDLQFHTSLGAVYKFPDMDVGKTEEFLRAIDLENFGQATLVNISGACLVLPLRIVTSVAVNGLTRWTRP